MACKTDHNCSNNYINSHKIHHQNIGGLRNKINELIIPLYYGYPHILCLTEHHLRNKELDMTSIEHYNLGTRFCRHKLKKGV
jgi:hypothetical protein